MTTAATPPWYVLSPARVSDLPPTALPESAPTAAQFLHGAQRWLSPLIRADIRAGHVNSRRVRTALAQLATQSRIPITPSRSEMERAANYLRTRGLI